MKKAPLLLAIALLIPFCSHAMGGFLTRASAIARQHVNPAFRVPSTRYYQQSQKTERNPLPQVVIGENDDPNYYYQLCFKGLISLEECNTHVVRIHNRAFLEKYGPSQKHPVVVALRESRFTV